jgi:hypothetical protein
MTEPEKGETVKLRAKILGGYGILLLLMIVVWGWAVASWPPRT